MNLLQYESAIRLGCFAAILGLMTVWEVLAPRRRLTTAKPARWFSNLSLVVLDTVLVRLLIPFGAIAIALLTRQQGWGLLNNLSLPPWLAVVLGILLLDLAIYLQHVLFHALPLLWRIHRVHHADLDFDVTTGVRFHPIEILLSLGIKGGVVVLLGPPALAVLLFEVLLNATSLFNHGNVYLPLWLDRPLRLLVVTPEMHRVHHSTNPRETNSNFGFSLPWWDFLFGTYRAQPAQGHQDMTIGLAQFREEKRAERLPWMLLLPFLDPEGSNQRAEESMPGPGVPPILTRSSPENSNAIQAR